MSQVQLKLVGADTYICRGAGIGVEHPCQAGNVVSVSADDASYLLSKSFIHGNSQYPVFSEDLEAPVFTRKTAAIPLEDRKAIEELERKERAELAEAQRERDEAKQQAADLMARIEALESKQSSAAEPTKAPKKKAAPRKRKAASSAD